MNTVTTGNTILAADINQIVNVLQRPAGQQEISEYILEAGLYAANAFMTQYMRSTSQGATPSGVVIDTSIIAATNCNAPTTDQVSQYGFRVKATATGINTDCRVGGIYTLSF